MIYAVIVTFNPNVSVLTALLSALITNGVVPVVIDNASIEPLNLHSHLNVIRLESNFGIAKAQNVGIDFAVSKHARAIIFFDQDSSISDNEFIQRLYAPILQGKSKITAPVFSDLQRGFTYPIVEIKESGFRVKHYPQPHSSEFFVNNVISSGTMVDVAALKEIGSMAEHLFIDYVDTEWCLRANSKGFNILIVPQAVMTHSIGDKTLKIAKYYVPKHSPTRRYYRIRNSFYLYKLSYVPKIMAVREISFSVIHQLILIAFSTGERYAYLKSLLRGLSDGFKGKFG